MEINCNYNFNYNVITTLSTLGVATFRVKFGEKLIVAVVPPLSVDLDNDTVAVNVVLSVKLNVTDFPANALPAHAVSILELALRELKRLPKKNNPWKVPSVLLVNVSVDGPAAGCVNCQPPPIDQPEPMFIAIFYPCSRYLYSADDHFNYAILPVKISKCFTNH